MNKLQKTITLTMNKELIKYRFVSDNLKTDKQTRTITGTAIVFNSLSEKLYDWQNNKYFREKILPDAVSMEFLDKQDIIMTFNHRGEDLPLARSYRGKGTLSYSIDTVGVHFSFVLKEKDNDILESIESGDITSCSFQYWNEPADERIIQDENGEDIHEVFVMRWIGDFSIVTRPAYSQTNVEARQRQLEQEQRNKLESEIKARLLKEEKLKVDNDNKIKNERKLNFINLKKSTF